MAKTTSPLFGFEAAGSLGDTLTYASWRGVRYARRYVIPADPNTAAQQTTRNTFRWLNSLYKILPAAIIDPWLTASRGRPFTDRNLFIKANNGPLRGQSGLANLTMSPGALSGPIASTFSVTPDAANNQITVDAAPGTLSAGWTVAKFHAVLLSNQQPSGEFSGLLQAAEDATSPYQVLFTGLTDGSYYVAGWFEYSRPDGLPAYGPSQAQIVSI